MLSADVLLMEAMRCEYDIFRSHIIAISLWGTGPGSLGVPAQVLGTKHDTNAAQMRKPIDLCYGGYLMIVIGFVS